MVFHLIGAERVEIADGGGTLASAQAFLVIHPMAAGIFQPGTKWRAVGQTIAATCKTHRRFTASKQPEKRLSSPLNGDYLRLLEVTLPPALRPGPKQHPHTFRSGPAA